MAHAAWRLINVLCAVLACIVLLLQIVAIASGTWKVQYVILNRFEAALNNMFMYRKIGLFTSVIEVSDPTGRHRKDYVVTTSNRFPMVMNEALMHCTSGPSLRYQLTICDQYHRAYDCHCRFFDHWLALVVLELTSLPLLALLVVCCALLRAYPQRFLKSTSIFLCILSLALVLAGFVLVFQFWDLENDLFSRILPYYVRMIMIQLKLPTDPVPPIGLVPYDEFYTSDNIHMYPGWSAFVSLGTLLGLALLAILLGISWVMDMSQSAVRKKTFLPEGGTATYRRINN